MTELKLPDYSLQPASKAQLITISMTITHQYRLLGSILAFSAVLFGAFGAHALRETLSAHDSIQTWETAVRYQMWHALALILLSMISLSKPIPKMTGPASWSAPYCSQVHFTDWHLMGQNGSVR